MPLDTPGDVVADRFVGGQEDVAHIRFEGDDEDDAALARAGRSSGSGFHPLHRQGEIELLDLRLGREGDRPTASERVDACPSLWKSTIARRTIVPDRLGLAQREAGGLR